MSADAKGGAVYPGPQALLIAALNSGAGKSVVTLALLRALRNAGRRVVSAKSGPDYLDPTFHAAASVAPSVNLDAWAMCGGDLRARANNLWAHERRNPRGPIVELASRAFAFLPS